MSDVIGTPNRLHDGLRRPDARGREVETAMAMHLSVFAAQNNLGVHDMIRGLTGNIVAIVFAKASSPVEAREAIETICAELKRRITQH